MLDFNDAAPQQLPQREPQREPERAQEQRPKYVPTVVARQAVEGREADVVRALGILWHGHDHITCPYPGHDDKDPSWRLMDNGNAVCTCTPTHSVFDVAMHLEGLSFEDAKIRIMEAIGRADLIVDPNAEKPKPEGLTIEQFSEAKRLPVPWLRMMGLHQGSYGKLPAVRIPFKNEHGVEQTVQFRVAMSGNKNQLFKKGTTVCLYGAHQAVHLPGAGYAIICEGVSDTLTLWNHGFPGLGLPGAGSWREDRDAHLFDGVPTIFVVVEPDTGGESTMKWLARSSIAPRVRLIRLPPETKDPSALYLANPEGFRDAFIAALDAAQPVPVELIQAAQAEKPPEAAYGVSLDDFWAYMPQHNYIFAPTRSMWPAGSVNSRLGKVGVGKDEIPASMWLDQRKPVEQMTWCPGLPMIIKDRLIQDGGWINRKGVSCFNQYLPPTITGGDPSKAGPWLDHVQYVYPHDADHILDWFAHRVQRPEEKINHSIVFGGKPGIGKDTMLEPVKQAIGPWNFQDVTPTQITERFNGYLKAVILRISEARDTGGNFDRFQFYEHTKTYMASPPDVLRVDEKHIKEYAIFNVVGVIITTNHKTDGLYLPDDDRRHYVAWSDKVKEDPHFAGDYWKELWAFYHDGGFAHVAAYLSRRDIRGFDPKAPPPKTAAFWEIADSGTLPEEPELMDVLDALGTPDAVTLVAMQAAASGDFGEWLKDRKNRRAIPHRLERCGYVAVRNTDATDGLWKAGGKRQAVYARTELSESKRMSAARTLVDGKPQPWQPAGQSSQ